MAGTSTSTCSPGCDRTSCSAMPPRLRCWSWQVTGQLQHRSLGGIAEQEVRSQPGEQVDVLVPAMGLDPGGCRCVDAHRYACAVGEGSGRPQRLGKAAGQQVVAVQVDDGG